jgi:hypothetical protein
MSCLNIDDSVTMPLVNAGYGPMVSVGAITHEGALIRQLPELVLLDVLDELALLVELEELFDAASKLDELLESEPPQPATVIAPSAVNACRRVK